MQLFTAPSLVQSLIANKQLLSRLFLALDWSLHTAALGVGDGESLPAWPCRAAVPDLDCDAVGLVHRRYDYLVRDIDFVMHIDGVAQAFARQPQQLRRWLQVLRRAQGADLQQRQLDSHVELDSRSWINAFNLNISLSSLYGGTLGCTGFHFHHSRVGGWVGRVGAGFLEQRMLHLGCGTCIF